MIKYAALLLLLGTCAGNTIPARAGKDVSLFKVKTVLESPGDVNALGSGPTGGAHYHFICTSSTFVQFTMNAMILGVLQDSSYVVMDGGSQTTWQFGSGDIRDMFAYSTTKSLTYAVSQGPHTLSILEREDGGRFDHIKMILGFGTCTWAGWPTEDYPAYLSPTIMPPWQVASLVEFPGRMSSASKCTPGDTTCSGTISYEFDCSAPETVRISLEALMWNLANTVNVQLNGGPWEEWILGSSKNWEKSSAVQFSVGKGTHKVTIGGSSPGVKFRSVIVDGANCQLDTAAPMTDTPRIQPTNTPISQVPTTAVPTLIPTVVPTAVPTQVPRTAVPTAVPTARPPPPATNVPTAVPPTPLPTSAPTVPTAVPTQVPRTSNPVTPPTAAPTRTPTAIPTTAVPTAMPTAPTAIPTTAPTRAPTATPTVMPTAMPTLQPTVPPTQTPPTLTPTSVPTSVPTTTSPQTPSPTVAPTTAAPPSTSSPAAASPPTTAAPPSTQSPSVTSQPGLTTSPSIRTNTPSVVSTSVPSNVASTGVPFSPGSTLTPGATLGPGNTLVPFAAGTPVPGSVGTPPTGVPFSPGSTLTPGATLGPGNTLVPFGVGMVPTLSPGSVFTPGSTLTPGTTLGPGKTLVPLATPSTTGVPFSPGSTLTPGSTLGPGKTLVPFGIVPTRSPGSVFSPGSTLTPGTTLGPGETLVPLGVRTGFNPESTLVPGSTLLPGTTLPPSRYIDTAEPDSIEQSAAAVDKGFPGLGSDGNWLQTYAIIVGLIGAAGGSSATALGPMSILIHDCVSETTSVPSILNPIPITVGTTTDNILIGTVIWIGLVGCVGMLMLLGLLALKKKQCGDQGKAAASLRYPGSLVFLIVLLTPGMVFVSVRLLRSSHWYVSVIACMFYVMPVVGLLLWMIVKQASTATFINSTSTGSGAGKILYGTGEWHPATDASTDVIATHGLLFEFSTPESIFLSMYLLTEALLLVSVAEAINCDSVFIVCGIILILSGVLLATRISMIRYRCPRNNYSSAVENLFIGTGFIIVNTSISLTVSRILIAIGLTIMLIRFLMDWSIGRYVAPARKAEQRHQQSDIFIKNGDNPLSLEDLDNLDMTKSLTAFNSSLNSSPPSRSPSHSLLQPQEVEEKLPWSHTRRRTVISKSDSHIDKKVRRKSASDAKDALSNTISAPPPRIRRGTAVGGLESPSKSSIRPTNNSLLAAPNRRRAASGIMGGLADVIRHDELSSSSETVKPVKPQPAVRKSTAIHSDIPQKILSPLQGSLSSMAPPPKLVVDGV